MPEAPRFRAVMESGHSAERRAVTLGLDSLSGQRFEMLLELG